MNIRQIALTLATSDVFKNGDPKKMTNLGSFTIPCYIGSMDLGRALCDLRASINLRLLFVFKNLGIGKVKPTTVALHLVDISIVQPKGRIENALVKVDKFIFPTNFIILDYEADREEEVIVELFSSEEFIKECPKDILEEVNVVSDVRKFEPLNLQNKGHKISNTGLEVDPVKVDVVSKIAIAF
ncbi:uncharacterized protein E6C27_scaffold138G00780 [Cucumis melo var. makuwa]|uniref:Gag-asp_proteas domain-containing protein n=1 Tax=Cucumis melo var. makuwa TaxID=1194695 RepID=A0A5A7VHV2_CUCMM|nr:uncharacterized protein E6C27_scaffold138G00780 [Cucumis melo var. makuwa]